MNVILLEEHERQQGDRFQIRGVKARHLAEVLGAVPGSTIKVGLLEGPLGAGEVIEVGAEQAVIEVRFEAERPPRALLDLILAIARPKSLAKVLPEIAALGVDRLILLRTWRVQKPYLTSAVLEPERIRALLLEGLSQARCTRLPEVSIEPLFRPFVEDRAPELFRSAALKAVAHPGSSTSLAELSLTRTDRAVLAIGPEGGWIPFEVAALQELGFVAIDLGSRLLRVETAVVAAIAQLELLRRFTRGGVR